MKHLKFRQCKLERQVNSETHSLVTYIPESFAVIGKVLKVMNDNGEWIDGWVVMSTGDLTDSPELINSDPYGDAWMLKIVINDPSELEDLMDADTYANLDRDH